MPHSPSLYKTKDGQRVPSVTTVLSQFKECKGLMKWAHRMGLEGKDIDAERDKAADAGTLAHQLIENFCAGKSNDDVIGPAEQLQKAYNAFGAFQRWAAVNKFRVVEQEVSLVSEVYRFAGTLDSVMSVEVNGELSLIDYKTSNQIYYEYLVQLAGYDILWAECRPDMPITGGYHILRVSKDNLDFSHRSWDEIEDAKRAFVIMRELYDLKWKLEKRVK